MMDPVTGTLIGGEQPTLRVPFARVGAWRHPKYGDIVLDNSTLEALRSNFQANVGGSRPYIRVGHDTGQSAKFGAEPALAWIHDIEILDEVAYALAKPTSSDAVKLIKDGHYRYSSMEFDRNHIPRDGAGRKRPDPIGPVLFAVALTNEPFLTGLPEAQVLLSMAEDAPSGVEMVFALDYGEASPLETPMLTAEEIQAQIDASHETFLTRLVSRVLGRPLEADPVSEPVVPLANPAADAARLAAEHEAATQLANERTAREAAERALADARHATHVTEVAARLAQAQHDGVAPALLAAMRPLLLAADAMGTVQCSVEAADGTTTLQDRPMSDVLLAVLDAYPAEKRINFGIAGKTAETTDKEAQLAVARDAAERHMQPGQILVAAPAK